jgi:nonsense-mediated mRNA decay protein 3
MDTDEDMGRGESAFPDFTKDLEEDSRRAAGGRFRDRGAFHEMTDEDLMMDPSLSAPKKADSGYSMIMCPLCQAMIEPNAANMCIECLNSKVDISEGITKELVLFQCRNCDRWYDNPRYIEATLESPQLLAICIKMVNGLGKKVRLTDARWLWTEPHSRRMEMELTVQAEVFSGAIVQKKFTVNLEIENQQCSECQASFTHHSWAASVQVRQKVKHKRTFLFLEQLILKHKMTVKCIGVSEQPDGIDFFFASLSHARTFVSFLHSMVPIDTKISRRLISHDTKSNTFKFKYSCFAELAPVCRLDLVLIPPKLRPKLGGKSPLMLCYKVTDKVHMVEPSTLHCIELDASQYFQHRFMPLCSSSQTSKYFVMSCEPIYSHPSAFSDTGSMVSGFGGGRGGGAASSVKSRRRKKKHGGKATADFDDTLSIASGVSRASAVSTVRSTIGKSSGSHKFKLAEVEVVREEQLGEPDAIFYRCLTHMGGVIKVGDLVEGYDLNALGVLDGDSGLLGAKDAGLSIGRMLDKMRGVFKPEVVIVRKHYDRSGRHHRRRKWKLKHLVAERVYVMTDLEQQQREKDEEFFMNELEEDFEMRCRINVFRKTAAELDAMSLASTTVRDEVPQIEFDEMLDDFEDLGLSDPVGDAEKLKEGATGAADGDDEELTAELDDIAEFDEEML